MQHAGGVELLAHLEQSGSVAVDEEAQTVTLLDRRIFFSNLTGISVGIQSCLASIGSLIETMVHNFENNADEDNKFFQRANWTNRLDSSNVTRLRKKLRRLPEETESKSFDILLSCEENEIEEGQLTAGIGLYYFEDDMPLRLQWNTCRIFTI